MTLQDDVRRAYDRARAAADAYLRDKYRDEWQARFDAERARAVLDAGRQTRDDDIDAEGRWKWRGEA